MNQREAEKKTAADVRGAPKNKRAATGSTPKAARGRAAPPRADASIDTSPGGVAARELGGSGTDE